MSRRVATGLATLVLLSFPHVGAMRTPASTTSAPPAAVLKGAAAIDYLRAHGLYGSLRDAVAAARYDWHEELTTFTQQQKLLASDGEATDLFGVSVAISGETVVVGASPDDGVAGTDQGSAYVFARSGGVWIEQQKLIAADAAAHDRFGVSVAIDGETIVVGAPFEDDGVGSAYVFVRSGNVWSQQQKLVASDAGPSGLFGFSVGISGDSIVAGVPFDETTGIPNRGAAYVFVRSGTSWSQQQKLLITPASQDDVFGWSVAISQETLVVGAPQADFTRGSAHVFVRAGEVWNLQQKLVGVDPVQGDGFGRSVRISGDTVVVGAPDDNDIAGVDQGSATVFARNGTTWTPQQKLLASDAMAGDEFGWSVAISAETVVVGAHLVDGAGGSDQGSAYVFVRSGGVWTEHQKLLAPDAETIDRLGHAVAISGGTLVAAAIQDDDSAGVDQGSAYVFTVPPNNPPTIAATALSRAQGAPASTSSIADVSDAEDTPSALTVTLNGAASATVNGVTVSSISVDASGQVTALVGADCSATNASFTLRGADSGGLFAETTLSVTATPDAIAPVLTCPSNVLVTLPPNSTEAGMVVNYPAPSATDHCTASPTTTASQGSGTVFPLGLTTVNVTAVDAANNQAMCSFTVAVQYNFGGFFAPVDNPPTVNVVNAGRAVPIKFSLSGNKGSNIFAAGYPASQQTACSDGAPASEIEQTVLAGASSLSYDATSDHYTYIWKTEQSWTGSCRRFTLRLNDGTERVALFRFK